MKDKLVKDIELKLAMSGYSHDAAEKIMCCVISCLSGYEVTEAVTDLVVRYEDQNEDILKRYVVCLQIDGKSEGTIKQYLWTLKKMSELVKKPFTELSANDIRLFLGSLKVKDGKNTYIKGQRARISAFCHWMVAEELIAKNPCDKVGQVKAEQEILFPFSSVEIDRLRSSITGKYAVRDRAVVEVMLSSGVRCAELCGLAISDLDIKSRTLHVRKGKGNKDRIVYISEVAAEYLTKYLDSRKDGLDVLFLSRRSGAFTPNGVGRMLGRLGDISGVAHVHPHRFRRTFATTMHKRGMPIEEIRRLMGHTEIQTTLRYIYADDTQLKAAYDKYAA